MYAQAREHLISDTEVAPDPLDIKQQALLIRHLTCLTDDGPSCWRQAAQQNKRHPRRIHVSRANDFVFLYGSWVSVSTGNLDGALHVATTKSKARMNQS